MARWGEGDPRWIVEERPDATNVNNWHWTEKNATSWSKHKLRSLLMDVKFESGPVTAKITEISTLEGEATASNRKAKLIFFWEWDIKCSWEGRVAGDEEVYKGNVTVPNLSDEQDAETWDVEWSIDKTSDNAYMLKDKMHREGTLIVKKQLESYVRELKEEFSKGLILPTKTSSSNLPQLEKANSDATTVASKDSKTKPTSSEHKAVGLAISTKTVHFKETFQCAADDLYRALTLPEMVQAFTNGPAVVDAKKGGRFVLYHGMVEGTFTELVPNEKLVMQWRMKPWPEGHYSTVTMDFKQGDCYNAYCPFQVPNERLVMQWRMKPWPEGHYSTVTMDFKQGDCSTDLIIDQTLVPSDEAERTEEGWKRHYFEAMRVTFGFGAKLL